jgi:hypothetical protein
MTTGGVAAGLMTAKSKFGATETADRLASAVAIARDASGG